jgi:hypothetical protein
MKREQALVAETRHGRIERRQCLREKGEGSMPVRLIQGCTAQPFGLSAIDAKQHRRIVTRGTAKRRLVTMERDKQNRRSPAAAPCLPCGLKRAARGLAGDIDHDHLKGVLPVTDIQNFGLKPALTRERQGPRRPL